MKNNLMARAEVLDHGSGPTLEGSDAVKETENWDRINGFFFPSGRESLSEARLEVVKMGDEQAGRKFLRSSCESFGKDEERKRARCSFGSRSSYGETFNRMDETFEAGLESKAPKNWVSCSLVPLKLSRRTLLGISGSIRISHAEAESWNFHVRERGVFFERERNRGHASTAPGTHQPQR